MRKRRLKRLTAAFLSCIMMVSCLMVNVYAEDDLEEIVIPSFHTTTETETEVSAISQAVLRGAYLASGSVKLGINGGGSINIYGSTASHSTCDMLYLNIYLERSTNGTSWSSYDSWSYTKANGTTLTKSFNITVPTGYYYRLCGYHAVQEGSNKESTPTATGGKYVS
ncbi:DUF6147 family protein [Ruminococcus sp. OA3]|uniref:DUF6147 family protein n=1 Tax=Ruminococcus sp. OA3 TaxID=2914164 RepID=UPI001F057662|nr:DUF6147 family protein [Ruminococcus sp. OA3]MCH1981099.1 DUF6147 family protein [Ruminococcus sp. OA3]